MESVKQHYVDGRGELGERSPVGLRQARKDLARLVPEDLAPVDAFHIRSRDRA